MGAEAMSATVFPAMRSCAAITGSVLAFAFLIEAGGLIPATAVATFVASTGSRAVNIRHALLLSVGVAVAMAVLFVGLLNQPLSLVAGF
jgi:hypothetical protein